MTRFSKSLPDVDIKHRVDMIHVPQRIRSNVDPERVTALAESMRQIGLQMPITVYDGEHTDEAGETYDATILVAGLHRLLAARSLGWPTITCCWTNADEVNRRRWEIAENLHRAELTALERSEHVAEWIRLTEQAAKEAAANSAKNVRDSAEQKPCQVDTVSKGGRGKTSGINHAARELDIPGKTEEAKRLNAHRAVKIDSITPQAKEAAKYAKLDDNQSALLKVAAAPPEKQVQEVQRIAEQRSQPAATPFEGLVRFLERLGKIDGDTFEFPPLGDVGPLELLDTIKAAEATLRKLRLRVEALP